MAKQMLNLNQESPIGWLVWWTIPKDEYDLQIVETAAADHDVPVEICSRLSGRNRESAWRKATQLGAVGKSIFSSTSLLRRLVTRPTASDEIPSRALVVESTNFTWETEDTVTAKTAVILELEGGYDFKVQVAEWAMKDPAWHEILGEIDYMRSEMYRIEGRIDDGRIRASLFAWLSKRHKVTVRGSGGVYYLPFAASRQSKEEFETELLKIRDWLKAIGASFSVFGINAEGAHSIDAFVADATDEIKSDLKDISEKIKNWEGNSNMNAGSRHYSAGTQIERMSAIEEKVEILKESLGEEIGVVDEMTNMVKARLDAMVHNSSREMVSDKEQRHARRREVRKNAKSEGRKSGTAKDRSNQSTFS